MKTLFAALFLSVLAASCTQTENARSVLEQAGYENIEMTGFSWWGCGEDDDTADGFVATSPSGATVTGVVCGGWFFKGLTIRITP